MEPGDIHIQYVDAFLHGNTSSILCSCCINTVIKLIYGVTYSVHQSFTSKPNALCICVSVQVVQVHWMQGTLDASSIMLLT